MSAADYFNQGIAQGMSLLRNFVQSGAGRPDLAASDSANRGQGDRSVRGFLSKNESFLVTMQKIVLWENAALSSIFLTCFTLTYWFLASLRPLGLMFEVAFVYYIYVMIRDYVYKAVSVSPTVEQAQDQKEADEWTLMENSVFSAPELHVALHKFRAAADRYLDMFLTIRRDQPKNYAILMLGVLSTAAFIGSLVSGPVLLYGLALCAFTAPGIIHNSVQLNQIFWNIIGGPDSSADGDKHVEEFLWKASREDLRVLEKAASQVNVENLYAENGSDSPGSSAARDDEANGARAAVSKDSSDSGSLVDETLEKIGPEDLRFVEDDDEASSFEEYDPGEFPSMDTADLGPTKRAVRNSDDEES